MSKYLTAEDIRSKAEFRKKGIVVVTVIGMLGILSGLLYLVYAYM